MQGRKKTCMQDGKNIKLVNQLKSNFQPTYCYYDK